MSFILYTVFKKKRNSSLLSFTVKWNLNDESMHFRLNVLENIATVLVFIIVIVNVFITAFGVQSPKTSA